MSSFSLCMLLFTNNKTEVVKKTNVLMCYLVKLHKEFSLVEKKTLQEKVYLFKK